MNSRLSFGNLGWASWGVATLAILASIQPARAVSEYSPGDLSDLTQTNVEALIELAALGANHRAYNSARPLGLALGFDIGFDLTVISVPEDFRTALALATDQPTLALPTLPLPKVSIFKGFGGGVDLGFSFISSGEAFSIYGGSIQWAFLRKSPVGPHAALRLSAAFSDLSFISTSNYGLDLIVSKKLAIIDPYLGAGFQLWSGSLEVPNFPGGLTNSNSGFSPHIFVGLPINLLFLKLVGEYDYNFAGVTTYGGKIALSF